MLTVNQAQAFIDTAARLGFRVCGVDQTIHVLQPASFLATLRLPSGRKVQVYVGERGLVCGFSGVNDLDGTLFGGMNYHSWAVEHFAAAVA